VLERVIVEINPDNKHETDKNNAERHATVPNSSPNPARDTRKIFVTTSADVTRAAGTDDNENHVPLVAREKIEVYESRSLWRILTTSAKQVKTLLSDAH